MLQSLSTRNKPFKPQNQNIQWEKNMKKTEIGGNVDPVINLYHKVITRDTEEPVEGAAGGEGDCSPKEI